MWKWFSKNGSSMPGSAAMGRHCACSASSARTAGNGVFTSLRLCVVRAPDHEHVLVAQHGIDGDEYGRVGCAGPRAHYFASSSTHGLRAAEYPAFRPKRCKSNPAEDQQQCPIFRLHPLLSRRSNGSVTLARGSVGKVWSQIGTLRSSIKRWKLLKRE